MSAEISSGFGRRLTTGPAATRPVRDRSAKSKADRPVAALGQPGAVGTIFIVAVFVIVAVAFQSILWFAAMHAPLEAPSWATQGGDAWSSVAAPADPRKRIWAPAWLVLGLAALVGGGVGALLAQSRFKRAIGFWRSLIFCLAGYFTAWMLTSTLTLVTAMWWSASGRDPVKLLLSALMGPFGGVLGGAVALVTGILLTGPLLAGGSALIFLVTRWLDRSGKAAA